MAEIIKMPKLSDTMTEGVIASWHKKVGDTINIGDVLAEIESDKATMEFESFHSGKLLHIEGQSGKSIPVDSVIAIIGKEGEDVKSLLKSAQSASPAPAQATVSEKAPKAKEEPKVASKTPAPVAAVAKSVQPSKVDKPLHIATSDDRLKISPLARTLADQMGISLRGVKGTGEGGRIVRRDIDKLSRSRQSGSVERYRDVEISSMRKTIARRLSESKFSAPHFYLTIDLDMDQAVQAREAINKAIAPDKISFNDLIIKAAAAALCEHPQVNAGWHDTFIRYNDHVHIGVAVAVDEGLLVPVVRFASDKTLTQISAEVRDFAQRAKQKKLQPQDWEGNTFTISNLGMFGIEQFTAIINPPDSCILAVGSIRQEPVVKDGQVRIGNRMKVCMSCDHRVVDGVSGARFLETFRSYVENPVVLLGMGSI